MKRNLFLFIFTLMLSLSGIKVFADTPVQIQSDFIVSEFSVLSSPSESSLSDEQKEILEGLFISAIENYETSVDISDADIFYEDGSNIHNDVVNYFANIINDTPEYFYVDLTKSYFSIKNSILFEMSITYTYDVETIKEREKLYKQKAQKIIDTLNEKNITSDFDIALYLHDYIALNCEYDTLSALNPNTFKGHGIDAVFIDEKAVCQGYASAYKYLLNLAGIECINVYSELGHHEWSLVNIDGNWYHADVTFDDPTSDCLGYVSHELFLLTDEELANYDGSHIKYNSHSNWYTSDSGYNATDNTYSDVHWRDTTTAISFIGDFRYYTVYEPYNAQAGTLPKTRIVQCNENMEITNDDYYTINDIWYSKDSMSSFWPGFHSGLSEYNNCLYYNTGNKLMKIDTTADMPKAQVIMDYVPETSNYQSNVYLFGSYINDNILYYAEINYVTIDNQTIPLGTKNSEKMSIELQKDMITVDDSSLIIDTQSNIITGTVTVDINIDEDNANVYFAVYENGILKHIVKTTPDNTIFDVSLKYNKDNNYTYKLFVWNESFSPFVPIVTDIIE